MKTEDWDKVGEELIDQIEAGRHIYMKLRHTTSKETADHGVAWFRGLVEGSKQRAREEQQERAKALDDADFLISQFEQAVAIFTYQEIF